MTLRSREVALHDALRHRLSELGFDEVGTLDFFRPSALGGHTLRFGGRVDEHGLVHLSGTVGVVFQSINEVAGFGRSAEDRFPTIMMPLHLLHGDKSFFEWTMDSETDATRVATAILDEVTSHALPFLERFGKLGEVRVALQSGSPTDWFVLNPEQRLLILAAIHHLEGSDEEAKGILRAALAERSGEPAKRRLALEKALARLGSSLM